MGYKYPLSGRDSDNSGKNCVRHDFNTVHEYNEIEIGFAPSLFGGTVEGAPHPSSRCAPLVGAPQ